MEMEGGRRLVASSCSNFSCPWATLERDGRLERNKCRPVHAGGFLFEEFPRFSHLFFDFIRAKPGMPDSKLPTDVFQVYEGLHIYVGFEFSSFERG